MSEGRILLLEDEEWDARTVLDALKSNAATRDLPVVRARSLREALMAAATGPFLVVIADLNVGDSTGLDTVRSLRSRLDRSVPVVVLTGAGNDETGVEAIQLGAQDYLSKEGLHPPRLALTVRLAVERARLEQRAAQADRFEALASQRAFLANAMAHELNNPLTPIGLQLYLLQRGSLGTLSPAHAEAVEIAKRNLDRLRSLVGDFLDVARIESGRLQLRRREVDLGSLASDTVQTYRPLAERQGITMRAAAVAPVVVAGDENRLAQVMFNLCANALKYTPSGGTVSVYTMQEGDHGVFRVADTGRGLTADQKVRLFQPFARVHDDDPTPGTGLGLFVAKGIVEAHRGSIWCESAGPDRGSAFAFRIPLSGGGASAPAGP